MRSLRPVLLCLAPALAGLAPAGRAALLYDRAAILQGEWWRLWTGHWMHFSISHLAWNAVVLVGAGAWLERLQPGCLLRFAAVAAPLLSVSFLVGAPDMQAYGGLSGLVTGVVVLLALMQLRGCSAGRGWWLGVLALVVFKLAIDATGSAPLFASFGPRAVRSSAFAHVMGAIIATGFFLSKSLCAPGRAGRVGAKLEATQPWKGAKLEDEFADHHSWANNGR